VTVRRCPRDGSTVVAERCSVSEASSSLDFVMSLALALALPVVVVVGVGVARYKRGAGQDGRGCCGYGG
jgi:hypothetical protein